MSKFKFSTDTAKQIDFPNKILQCLPGDYSFRMTPPATSVEYGITVNQLTLTVLEGKVVEIEGLCPHLGWIKFNYEVPQHIQGTLRAESDLEIGFDYGLNDSEWPVYVNKESGWVCIGDKSSEGTAIEFIENCIAVLENSNLVSLWLHPQQLPN